MLDDLRTIFEFDGEKDHVHLLIHYPPKVSIAKRVNRLKSVSSRMLRKNNYPEIIKQYIQQQQTPL
jgi:putative transposase